MVNRLNNCLRLSGCRESHCRTRYGHRTAHISSIYKLYTMHSNKWLCLHTGHIFTPSALNYHISVNIDTHCRTIGTAQWHRTTSTSSMRGQWSESPRERHCRCLFKLGCSVCFYYMFHFYYYYYWKQHRRDHPTRKKKVAESEDSEVIVVDWIFSHMNLNILFD